MRTRLKEVMLENLCTHTLGTLQEKAVVERDYEPSLGANYHSLKLRLPGTKQETRQPCTVH